MSRCQRGAMGLVASGDGRKRCRGGRTGSREGPGSYWGMRRTQGVGQRGESLSWCGEPCYCRAGTLFMYLNCVPYLCTFFVYLICIPGTLYTLFMYLICVPYWCTWYLIGVPGTLFVYLVPYLFWVPHMRSSVPHAPSMNNCRWLDHYWPS